MEKKATGTGKKTKGSKRAPKKTPKRKATGQGSARGRRYSAQRKEALLAKYRELRKGGMDAQKAAKLVKVSYLTLRKWEKEAGLPKLKKKGAKKATKRGAKKVAKRRTAGRGRPKGRKAGRKASKKAKKTGRKASTITVQKGKLVLITPTGFRVEGISSRDLIQVLKTVK